MDTIPAAGVARSLIETKLADLPELREFVAGRISRTEFQRAVSKRSPEDYSLNIDQFNLATRFPVDEADATAAILDTMVAHGLLPHSAYDTRGYENHAAVVAADFRHDSYLTYIFPEEARLLYAVADILRPDRTLFVGSYYGYWAAFAMPAVAACGGTAVLIDPNRDVLELSRRNLTALGYADYCEFVEADAAAYLRDTARTCDMVVQDAEGPKTGAHPDWLDKAIYYPLTVATTPLLRPGGIMLAHNILLSNLTENGYFRDKIARNVAQLSRFHAYVDQHYDVVRDFATTEGVGVYRRSSSASSGRA